MPEINTRFLFTIALEIQVSVLGDTPYGRRWIFHFGGGSFDGPKLKGNVLPGGGGWSLIRRDDVMEVDARLILETNDNHQIYAAWEGTSPWSERSHGSPLSRRNRRPRSLLFPNHALLRDEFRKIRLAEPHLLDCQRFAFAERTNAGCFSGVVVYSSNVCVGPKRRLRDVCHSAALRR
jgi:Protein of unknown function (DUF3237)